MRKSSIPASAFTTGDVARELHLTEEGVRHLVREAQLACSYTPSGVRIFRKDEVRVLAAKRGEARLRGVKVLRAKKMGVRGQPHQLWLFRAPVIPFPASALEDSQVEHAESGRDQREPDNGDLVNSR